MKKIKIDENRILQYDTCDGYVMMHTIREYFLKDGRLDREYNLSRWDDYMFYGRDKETQNSTLTFSFDVDHPLYFPLFHLLKGEDELIIDDDDCWDEKKRYMRIYIKDMMIYLEFHNSIWNDDESRRDKYRVFIKNIGPDNRSKIDTCYSDVKKRLTTFFEEMIEVITEEWHQISIEEYMVKQKTML